MSDWIFVWIILTLQPSGEVSWELRMKEDLTLTQCVEETARVETHIRVELKEKHHSIFCTEQKNVDYNNLNNFVTSNINFGSDFNN